MIKKLLKLFLLLAIIGGIVAGVLYFKWYKEDQKAFKVEITTPYINVRKKNSIYEARIATVRKGGVYRVLEQYNEDADYVWYKIEYEKKRYGWISSDRYEPYVKEINSPNKGEAGKHPHEYAPPVIKYYSDVYKVLDIDHINYDHLEIVEASDYTIKHYVYFDEFPKDKSESQYWIEYEAVDEFGNKSSKVQLIEFEIKPSRDEVLDIKVLEEKRS